MSLELNDLPRAVFRATHVTSQAMGWRGYSNELIGLRKYMEIPITGDEFEVPIVAFMKFMEIVKNNQDSDYQAIVLNLCSKDIPLRYSTVDRYMRDVLVDMFSRNRLLRCPAKGKDYQKTYYATHGTVFSENYLPVFMCSWMMKKCYSTLEDGNLEIHYRFLYPIIRIDPGIYLSQSDSMEKFLIKKFVPIAFTDRVCTPFIQHLPDRIVLRDNDLSSGMYTPSLRIEESPFHIREASQPDINTTNEELRQTALAHVGEIMQ